MASRSSGLIGAGIGAAVGGYYGGAAGAQIGAEAGEGIGSVFGAKATEKYNQNRQFESEVRNYLFTKSLIDYQNEYNNPSNQMKRLQDAGLNPMLVYGSGNMVGNQSGTGSAPSTSPVMSQARKSDFDIMKFQAIDNAELNNQLMAERLISEKNQNDAFGINLRMQVANAKEQNSILKARSRYEEAMADIAEHDSKIYRDRHYTTSKDPSWLARLDQWSEKGKNNLQKALHDATYNSDGSKKPWYQFW